VDSHSALLNLVVQNFTFIAGHDGKTGFETLSHNVVFDGALEGACEDESLDAVGEDAVFDYDGGLLVAGGQDTNSAILEVALTNGGFAAFQ
jgi:hypothetical protein